MLNLPAKIITILLLLGVLVEYMMFPTAKDASPFHERVAGAVERVPMSFGSWEGRDVPLPAAAIALLGEPVFLAREYVDRRRDLSGTLVIVHCRDMQDLAGHYPPNCYPASGWSGPNPPAGEDVMVPLGRGSDGPELPMKRYAFERRDSSHLEELVVYDVFLIPGRSSVTSMPEVYRVASNHLYRPYGAAQVQVVIDGGFRRDQEATVVEALMAQARSLVEIIAKGPGDPAGSASSGEEQHAR